MAVERITAVALPPHAARSGLPPRPGPAAGDTLRLTLGQSVLDEILATTPDGQPLRLSGLGAVARSLAPSDVLLVRVLSTGARLELALFDTPPRSAASPGGTPPSMHPDQLAQRQLSWQPPEAAALARLWRAMVLGQGSGTAGHRAAPPLDGRSPAPLPAAPLADPLPAGRDAAPGTPAALTLHPDRWLYPAYAWGGLHLMLRLVDPDTDRPPARRRRRGPMALRLEVDIPGLGWVAVQVRLLADDVQLLFFVEDHAALQPVRDAIPMLRTTLAASQLRLAGCGVALGLPAGGSLTRLDLARLAERTGPSAAQLLPSPLFRAAAEVAVALSALLPPGGFSPVARAG